MKKIFKLLNTARAAIFPLPDPQDPVILEYWRRRSKYLSPNQIGQIISLIIDEAKISRGYGLFLRSGDLDQEITFWLVFLEYLTGPETIAQKFPFEVFLEFTTELLNQEFEKLNQYYFTQISTSKPKIIASNHAFRVHLESVRARIISAIYNGDLLNP